MTASAIDTLRYARRLREASAHISPIFVGNVVTTPDLEAAVAAVRANLAALETRLTWRVLGGMAAIAGLAVAFL